MVDFEEAKKQLLLHGSGSYDAAGQVLVLEDGFLGSLRPYRGLREKNFHIVMEALLTVGERVYLDRQVDRDLIETVWSMCWYARAWGLRPDGMLHRNRLIKAEDASRLERWIQTVEQTALRLLAGQPPHLIIYHYAEYIVQAGVWWDNIPFFITLMDRAVSDPDTFDAIEMILNALAKLGGLAKAVLPTLREAQRRTYTWEIPPERCTDSVRATIQNAIQSIEAAGGEDASKNSQELQTD
jgi:hypothetical protein